MGSTPSFVDRPLSARKPASGAQERPAPRRGSATLEPFCALGAPKPMDGPDAAGKAEDTPLWRLGFEAGRAAERDEAARDAEVWRVAEADKLAAARRALEAEFAPSKTMAALAEEARRLSDLRDEITARAAQAAAARLTAAFKALAPRFGQSGFAELAAREAAEWAASVAQPKLFCPENDVEAMRAALADAGVECAVEADGALAPLTARAEWADGAGEIDVAAMAARIGEWIDAETSTENNTEASQ